MGVRKSLYDDNERPTLDELKKYIELFDYPNVRRARIYFDESTKTVKVCADDFNYNEIGTVTYTDCALTDAYDFEYLYKRAFDYPRSATVAFSAEIEKRPARKKARE